LKNDDFLTRMSELACETVHTAMSIVAPQAEAARRGQAFAGARTMHRRPPRGGLASGLPARRAAGGVEPSVKVLPAMPGCGRVCAGLRSKLLVRRRAPTQHGGSRPPAGHQPLPCTQETDVPSSQSCHRDVPKVRDFKDSVSAGGRRAFRHLFCGCRQPGARPCAARRTS
jgi:hypothetical protein